MSNISAAALVEIRGLTNQAQVLARGTHSQRKEADVLLSRVSAIRSAGISTDEARRAYANEIGKEMGMPEVNWEKAIEQRRLEKLFAKFLHGIGENELVTESRDMAAGGSTLAYTAGPAGGFLVPMSFLNEVFMGVKALTPLMDEDVVTVRTTNTGAPLQVPSWDLTEISSAIVSENTQQSKGTVPTASQTLLHAYTYKTSPIACSFEFEQDSLPSVMAMLSTAFGIGLARGIGEDLQNGNGSSKPHGLLYNSADSGMTTASASAITADELITVFHSVNKIHRASPKCAWIFNDRQWETVRKTAAANSWRLLFDKDSDDTLLGKPVYIDPNLGDSVPGMPFVFGDLSRFIVRIGGELRVRRNMESAYIEYGQALYTAQLRVDSALLQPGSDQPVVYGKFGT